MHEWVGARHGFKTLNCTAPAIKKKRLTGRLTPILNKKVSLMNKVQIRVTNKDVFIAKFLAEQNSQEILEIALEFARKKEAKRCMNDTSVMNTQ